jgi:hypothetical protein
MFVLIPDKVSAIGLEYEISKVDWTVRSISRKGVRKIINPNKKGEVTIAGKPIKVYDLAKLANIQTRCSRASWKTISMSDLSATTDA